MKTVLIIGTGTTSFYIDQHLDKDFRVRSESEVLTSFCADLGDAINEVMVLLSDVPASKIRFDFRVENIENANLTQS